MRQLLRHGLILLLLLGAVGCGPAPAAAPAGGSGAVNTGAAPATPTSVVRPGGSPAPRPSAAPSAPAEPGAAPTSGPANRPARDYLPLRSGMRWTYDSNHGEYTVQVAETRPGVAGDFAVVATDLHGTITHEVFAEDSRGVLLYRRGLRDAEEMVEPAQPYLPEPLAPGQTWEWEGTIGVAPASLRGTIVGIESIQVEAGRFDALHVRHELQYKGYTTTTDLYLAPGIGPVKSDALAGNSRLTAELAAYKVP